MSLFYNQLFRVYCYAKSFVFRNHFEVKEEDEIDYLLNPILDKENI